MNIHQVHPALENHAAWYGDSRPFFLFYSMQTVHSPLQSPGEAYDEVCEDVVSNDRRTYCSMLVHVDESIGRLVESLSKHGFGNNTLVIISSDNGGSITEGAYNNPMRGGKWTIWVRSSANPP